MKVMSIFALPARIQFSPRLGSRGGTSVKLKHNIVDDPHNGIVKVYQVLAQKEVCTVGRGSDNDIQLVGGGAFSTGTSVKHCEFRVNDGQLLIRDVGSSHGTRVNGPQITPKQWVPIENPNTVTISLGFAPPNNYPFQTPKPAS